MTSRQTTLFGIPFRDFGATRKSVKGYSPQERLLLVAVEVEPFNSDRFRATYTPVEVFPLLRLTNHFVADSLL